jgi:integrase
VSSFARLIALKVDDYVQFRRGLGHAFVSQAATLRAFRDFVKADGRTGPITQALAIAFVLSTDVTPNVRAWRFRVVRRFAEYISVSDPRTETLDALALPRSRAIPPPRILDEGELARLLQAALDGSPRRPLRGLTLYTLLGLLASTGMRSGEALRLDRTDVDLRSGVLQIRRTKFRKNRLVPVHPTMREKLRAYAGARDAAFPQTQSPAFFLSLRGCRLSVTGFGSAFRQARHRGGLDTGVLRPMRAHDLRHRFAVTRLVMWHRERVDVQARLPLLATYLGHVHYSDTAYYISATADLLSLAAKRTFGGKGGEL